MILGAYITATAPGGSPVELRDDTLVGASITQGSAGLLEAVEPATLSLTILDPDGVWRNLIGFTTRLEVAIGGPPGSGAQTRFTGTVTDMRVTYDEAWLLSVIAVGPRWHRVPFWSTHDPRKRRRHALRRPGTPPV